MLENKIFESGKCLAFLPSQNFSLRGIAGIGLHAMGGAATGPGAAPGMPGHTTAVTPKTWTEGIVGKRCWEK